MRHKIPRQVKAGKLNTVIISLDGLKYAVRDPLGGLSGMVSWEHPVDIGIIRCPKAFSNVHRAVIDGRDHQDLVVMHNRALFFQFFECLYQLGTDIKLLHLVAPHGTYNAGCLFSLSEVEAVYIHVIPVAVFQCEYFFFSQW